MRIAISRHNGGNNQFVGFITIDIDQYDDIDIDRVANEHGLSDLAEMGESTIPEDYDWTGDEVYEVAAD